MTKSKKPGLRKMGTPPPEVDLERLDQFAVGGKVMPETETPKVDQVEPVEVIIYPWQESWVRKDVIKGMGVPLSEPYLLKLQFIAKNTRYSQRSFCREKLEAAIEQEIRNLLEQK